MSYIPPSTLRSLINNQVDNPSSLIIYRICKTLKIPLKEFFNSNLFDFKDIDN